MATKFTPDEKLRNFVEQLAATHVSVDEISRILSTTGARALSPDDIRKHFANELTNGPVRAKARIRASVLTRALAGDLQAIRLVEEFEQQAKTSVSIDDLRAAVPVALAKARAERRAVRGGSEWED